MIDETTCQLKLSVVMATGPDSVDVGGAMASGAAALTDNNAVLYAMGADGPGGSNKVQYAKIHDHNTSVTDDATNYGVFLANGLPEIASAALFSFEGDAADDGKTITVIAFTSGDDPITETVTLASGAASCATPMKGPVRIFTSDDLAAPLSILHDAVAVGGVPAGGHCASSELDIGLEAELDGTQTIATPATAPSGVTFSRPITAGARLLVDDGAGTLPAESSQGVFVRWTVVPEMLGSAPVHAYVIGYTPD